MEKEKDLTGAEKHLGEDDKIGSLPKIRITINQ
jgi:hypothetical protein